MTHARPRSSLVLVLALVTVALAGCLGTPGPGDGGEEVVLLTHESFAVSDSVLDTFTNATGIEVRIVRVGDAGTLVNTAILNKDAPLGDALFGVDNTLLTRALHEDLFVPHEPRGSDGIPQRFVLDDRWRVTPVDFGYVALNYDKAALDELGLEPPTDLAELTEPRWEGKLVVENPTTSSPGLAFLLTTVDRFGTEGDYTYLDYWRDLKANDVQVTDGWSSAYYTHFTRYGGDRPLVVSYTTSPAAEVYFAEEPLDEPPTGNVLAPGTTYEQVEFVGVLNGSRNPENARALVDFMVDRTFQEDIPYNMFVYPVNEDAELPGFYEHAPIPDEPASLPPERIDAERDTYLNAWFDVMVS